MPLTKMINKKSTKWKDTNNICKSKRKHRFRRNKHQKNSMLQRTSDYNDQLRENGHIYRELSLTKTDLRKKLRNVCNPITSEDIKPSCS